MGKIKFISFLLFFILLILFDVKPTFATTTACTPDDGYDACYISSCSGCSTGAKIQTSSNPSQFQSCTVSGVPSYCAVKQYRITYKCSGSGGDITTPLSRTISAYGSETSFSCSETRCRSSSTLLKTQTTPYEERMDPGDVVAFTSPHTISPYTIECLFNPETDQSDSWASQGVNYFAWPNHYVVSCLANSDCSSGQICDTSGNWDTWQCVSTSPPTVTTNDPTSLTRTEINIISVNLNGQANPNGSTTTGWFRYYLQKPSSCDDTSGFRVPDTGSVDLGAGTGNISFSKPITVGLIGKYFYCAIAKNSNGKVFGELKSFQNGYLVFISGSPFYLSVQSATGELGGIAGADQACLSWGNSEFGGTYWKAWLSDSQTSASSRLYHSNDPYALTDQTIIANNWAGLIAGNLAQQINKNLYQETFNNPAWTNTNTDGSIDSTTNTCSDWTSNDVASSGNFGYSSYTDSQWTKAGSLSCGYRSHLYCIEQPPPACSGNISLTLNPSTVAPAGSVTPTAAGLSNCYGAISFTLNSNGAQKSSCSNSGGSGCSGTPFQAPNSLGNYTYFAYFDKSNPPDNNFTDTGETSAPATLTVASATPASVSTCGAGGLDILEGLLTSPPKQGGTVSQSTTETTKCIIDSKAGFFPDDIPTFDSLKSLYYTQKK